MGARRGERSLAVGFGNRATPPFFVAGLKGSLCSGWEFTDARHDGTRIVAKLRSTGGMRMQFGFIPESDGDE